MAFFVRNNITVVKFVKRNKNTKFHSTFLRYLSTSSSLSGKIVPFKLSDIGEGIREVTVKEWFVKPGDKVSQFDNVCEVQSDKASVTITSRYDGFIKALRFKVDDIALVGQPLVDIELNDDKLDEEILENEISISENEEEKRKQEDNETREKLLGKVLTTPAVRRIAIEKGIRLKDVIGTGKNGRILKEDLLAYGNDDDDDDDTTSDDNDDENENELKKVNQLDEIKKPQSKAYAKHMWTTMTKSLNTPHFVYSDECDVTKLVNFRNEIKTSLKERGINLTYMPFFIKAISKSLEIYPELNGRINENNQTIEMIKSHNISIAIDTPEGLIVPNIKNCQKLDIINIAKELNRLQELGKKTSITPNDLSGGTFTLSNIGSVGGTYTKPVILSPQIAIGAIGKTRKLPRFDEEGKILAADIISISWSADHRVVDGMTIAKFSNLWKYYLENPFLLLLNV